MRIRKIRWSMFHPLPVNDRMILRTCLKKKLLSILSLSLFCLFCTNLISEEKGIVEITIVPAYEISDAFCRLMISDTDGDVLAVKDLDFDRYTVSLELPVGVQRTIRCHRFSKATPEQFKNHLLDTGSVQLDVQSGTSSITIRLKMYPYDPDTTKPIITIKGGDTVYIPMGDSEMLDYYLEQWEADDNESVVVTKHEPYHNVNIYNDSCYEVMYSATDESGNTGRDFRTICVIIQPPPEEPPILTVADTVVVVPLHGSFILPQYAAYSLIDGDITDSVTVSGEVDTATPGEYDIVFSVSDNYGNTTFVVVKVIVKDNGGCSEIPRITLLGEDTIRVPGEISFDEFRESYVEPGYTATSCDGEDITDQVVSDFIMRNPKYWYIAYNVCDEAGNNAAEVRRYFDLGIDEPQPPVIQLAFGDSLFTIIECDPWVEPGYSALDIEDGDITGNVIVDSSELVANICNPGLYSITYSVTNSTGLTTVVTRNVKVLPGGDPQPPVITLHGRNPDTILVNSCETYQDPGAIAQDIRDGDLTSEMTVISEVDCAVPGKYTVIYRVKDAAGWAATAQRTVYVVRDTSGDIFSYFGVPSPNPLPEMMNKTYTRYELEGEGPDLSEITKLTVSWNPDSARLFDMSLTMEGPPYYASLMQGITHSFAEEQPVMVLQGSPVDSLDGEYYVAIRENEFYWVKTDGSYAIIWIEQQE